jgi:zinc protease
VTLPELERAKRYLAGSYEIELQKNSALAAMLAFDERYGIGVQESDAYAQKILAVTHEMIQHVARTYLSVEHAAVVIVGPSATGEMVIEPSAERVES